jgi:selenocysteine-specific elongation factor
MEAVRARLVPDASARLFRSVADRLVAEGVVVRRDSVLAAPGHRVALADDAQAIADRVDAALVGAGVTPPDVNALAAELGLDRRRTLDLLGVLEKSGRAVRVAPDLFYAAAILAEVRAVLERELHARAQITAAELRDVLRISRKFSIALLDYFDRTGVTLRVGDARKLRRG